MDEAEFARFAGLSLEVGLGLAPWHVLGEQLRQSLNASVVTLMVGPASGTEFVDYMQPGDDGNSEAARQKPHDPSLPKSVAIAAQRLDLKEVAQMFEMVPERDFRRTQYYADFARRAGMYHRLGFSGLRGGARMAPLGIHRAEHAAPFDETDRRHVLAIKPLVKQALAIRSIAAENLVLGTGFAALDATGDALFILRADCRVLAASAAAEHLCVGHDAAFRRGRGERLTAASRQANAALDRLVHAVAVAGGSGGMVRLCTGSVPPPGLLLHVMPVPARLIDGSRMPGAEPGLALLLVRDLRRRARLSAASLRAALGLSPSEAAIACALGDGLTAGEIAADRAVSLETVRSQIRGILRKSGATGLRDLERILSLLPR